MATGVLQMLRVLVGDQMHQKITEQSFPLDANELIATVRALRQELQSNETNGTNY